MKLNLSFTGKFQTNFIKISGSKSESNRLLILRALNPNLHIHNLSDSDDTQLLQKALENNQNIIDIHHAGTAMRFLTAYFATQQGHSVSLTGSTRMKERPIAILVEALQQLGADIQYLEKIGYPPLKINGKKLAKNKISIPANVSSQYISALMLIGASLPSGIEITLKGSITSRPYMEMSLALLQQTGIEATFTENNIVIKPSLQTTKPISLTVESDWSSASYYYSIVALTEIGTKLTLSSFIENSLQGDKIIAEIYKDLGVQTTFNSDESITLEKISAHQTAHLEKNLVESPDIAQTIVVTCFGLGIGCTLTGLHTLKIKETDRLLALKTELEKLGAKVEITPDSIKLYLREQKIHSNTINTYQDHRMAMAFAPLAIKTDIRIENAEVVSKSYPNFWEDLKSIGFQINEI